MEMFCAGPFLLLVEALIFLTTRGALLFQGCDEISITICEHLVIALSVVFDIFYGCVIFLILQAP